MKRWRSLYAAFAILVLAAPLIAMQFTTEVNWSVGDFAAAALLLCLVWAAIEVARLLAPAGFLRAAGMLCAVALGLLVWAHLAVGVF